MRVALVTGAFAPSPEPVATTAKALVDVLVGRGHDVLVVAPGLGPASYRGVRVARTRLGDPTVVTRELARFRPDVVHLADPRLLGAAPLRGAARLGLPIVASQHSLGPVRDRWRSVVGSAPDVTLVTCRYARDRLRKTGESPTLWRPGVDLDLFRPRMRNPDLVARWGRGERLVVGHLGPVDRPNVVRRLADVGALPGVRLVLVRAGGDLDRLRARLPGAKVLGDMSGVDLAHAVASYDVLVQPRKKDLDAHGVRRALASGVPVVGLDAGGTADVVRHERNGLLADPDRTHGLRREVARLRDDPDLRRRLGEAARDSVRDRPWEVVVDELLDEHYAAAVAGHARVSRAR